MKIVGVWIKNFMSFYGEAYFPLADRGTILILGRNLDELRMRSNGAGKSTVSDALDWSLFGESPRDDVADAVVNDEIGKDCSVTTAIVDDEGRLIKITRNRGYTKLKDGPQYWVDGVEKTTLDSDVTQQQIEALIGLDRQVFRAAVLFAQGSDFTFADATDAERKEVLTKVLQLTEFDQWAETIDARLTDTQTKLQPLQIELSSTVEQMVQEKAKDFSGSIATWEEQKQQRLQSAAQTGQAAEAEVTRLAQLIGPQPPPPQVPPQPQGFQQDAQLQQLAARVNPLNAEIGAERGRYQDAQRRLQSLLKRGTGTCSECNQPITAQHVELEKTKLEKMMADLATRGQQLVAEQTQLDAQKAQLVEQRASEERARWQQASEIAAQRALAQKAINDWQQTQYAHGQAASAMQRAAAQFTQIQGEQNPYVVQQAQSAARLKQLDQRLTKVHVDAAELERLQAHLKFWKTGFSGKGLKSYILDSHLDEMTTECNRWVHLLTGGTIWVRFETQKQVGKGSKAKLSETFTLRVFRYNPDGSITGRNFRSWSGGEKHRIALGVDFGLARLVASRAKRNYDLLILDEIFQKSLDSAGKEAVAELLTHLAKEKSTILVIDHDIIFQGLFEETIFVEKKNRRSRILPGATDGNQPTTQASNSINQSAGG